MRHSESTNNPRIQHVPTTQPEQTVWHGSRKAISGNNTGEAPSEPLYFCDDFTSGHSLILQHPHSAWKQPPVFVTEHHPLAVPTPRTNPETTHRPLGHRANFITSGSEFPTISASSAACMARSDMMDPPHAAPHLIQRRLARTKAVARRLEDVNLQSDARVDSSPDEVSTPVAVMQDRLDHAIIQNKADLFLASLGLASETELSRLKKGITKRNKFIAQLAKEIRVHIQASSAQLRDSSTVATKWPETEFPVCIIMSDDG
ncbi:hypothetical protein JB92DRAFT_1234316 [Gautieria morchelliformis]|nr:hypothetical protein JB92DRAFT_1234316 [Gautieria morchelliformis]